MLQPKSKRGYFTDVPSDSEIAAMRDWQLDRELDKVTLLSKNAPLGQKGTRNVMLRAKGRIRAEIAKRKPSGFPC